MKIEYKVHPWTLKYDGQSPHTVEMHVAMTAAGETGLGYFVDPALPQEQRDLHFAVNGKQTRLQRTWSDEQRDRYVPTHLSSGCGFDVFFYRASDVEEFLELIFLRGKKLHIDFNLDVSHLIQHPAWNEMAQYVSQAVQQVSNRGRSVLSV